MTSTPHIRRGLVLSGGAALGAYQAGALGVLRRQSIEFEVVSAASVGVFHALAWNRGDMVYDLQQHWRDNVQRLVPFDPKRLLSGQSPFRLQSSVDGVVKRYRSSHPRPGAAGQVPILVSLTEARTGRNLIVDTSDPGLTGRERVTVLRAATAIPALGDGAVRFRGRAFYDGGFSNNLPAAPLLHRGLDELWLIPLFPPSEAARWKRSVTGALQWLRRHTHNPWLLGATGMLNQALTPTDLGGFAGSVVTIQPADARRQFTLRKALTFSVRHIDQLFAQGQADAERICQRYRAAP